MNALLLFTVLISQAPDRSAPPKAEAAKPFTIQMPTQFTLKNGIKVWHVERKRAPLVDVIASVDAGMAAESIDQAGLASHTAGMLTEGAGDLDAIAFSDAVESLGAEISSGAAIDNATVSLHTSSGRFNDALKLFALALTKPRFDDKEWKRVQAQTFGNFMYQSQEPRELAQLASARALWGEKHRFGWGLGGTPKTLVSTTTAHLKAFHAARYRPDTTTLIVVGDIDKKTLTNALESALGGWTATGPAPASSKLSPPEVPAARRVVTVKVPGAPQTVLRVTTAGPKDLLPFTADVDVMNTLLGGSFTSRLNNNLRERNGYSYGAGSRVGVTKTGSVFSVNTSVATPVTVPALQEIFVELDRILEPATTEEVERARNLAALSMPSAFDNGRGTAGTWATVVSLGLDPKRLQQFMTDAPKIDVKGVQGAAQRIVKPKNSIVIAVGDVDAFGKDLAPLGPQSSFTVDDLLPGLQEAAAQLGGAS
jgi:zinc protease